MGRRGPQSQLQGAAAVDRFSHRLTKAENLIAFIECLPVISGRLYQPNARMQLLDWQKDFLRKLKKETRLAVLSLPRKQGKSGLALALACAGLFTGAPLSIRGGQIMVVSASRAQADIFWKGITDLLALMPNQLRDLNVKQFDRHIFNHQTRTEFVIAPQDIKAGIGMSVSLAILDEIGSWPQSETKGKKVYQAIVSSSGARKNPLVFCLSTRSESSEHFFETDIISYCEQVERGDVEDKTVASIILSLQDKDLKLPERELVKRIEEVNPSFGSILSPEDLKTAYRQAKRLPQQWNSFLNLRCNMQIKVNQEEELFRREDWDACKKDYTIDDLKGETLIAGLDLSRSVAMTALVLYSPFSRRTITIPFVAKDSQGFEHNRELYTAWNRMGILTVHDSKIIDYRDVASKIFELSEEHDISALAVDPAYSQATKTYLSEMGFIPPIVDIRQNWANMSPAIKALVQAVLTTGIYYNSQVMTHCVMNAVFKLDRPSRNYLVERPKSLRHPTDALMALLNCISYELKNAPATLDIDFNSIFV